MDAPGMTFKNVGGSNPFLFRSDTLVPGREVTIDATYTPAGTNGYKLVQAGAVIGKITASGLHRECTATVLTKDAGASDVVYYVDNAKAFVVGDKFSVYHSAAWIAAQTITAIELGTADGDKITVDTTLGAAVSAADPAKADDGSYDAIGVAINTTDVTKGDGAVTLAKRADLNEVGMPYAVTGKNHTLPDAVKTALLALTDADLTVEGGVTA